jgi:predicted dehydrogenase
VENGNRREIREWIEAIQTGGPCTIPGEEGMANIELALAILESSKRKQRIELPLEG